MNFDEKFWLINQYLWVKVQIGVLSAKILWQRLVLLRYRMELKLLLKWLRWLDAKEAA